MSKRTKKKPEARPPDAPAAGAGDAAQDARGSAETAPDLQAELDRLAEARAALVVDLDAAAVALRHAQREARDRTDASRERLASAQSLHTGLKGSIDALDADADELRAQLDAAERAGRKAEAVRRMAELSREADGRRATADAAWRALGRAVEDHAHAYAVAGRSWHDAAREYDALREEHGVTADEVEGAGGAPDRIAYRSGGRMYGQGEHPDGGVHAETLREATDRAGRILRERLREETRERREAARARQVEREREVEREGQTALQHATDPAARPPQF